MKNIWRRTKRGFVALCGLTLLLTSCQEKNMMEYFEEPSWLRGSIYEELQASGDYTLFLEGVDSAGFAPMVKGKSILTVMAPDDEAMTAYLDEHYGGKRIAELPKDELKKLIGNHLLYYSFDKDALVNFRPIEGDGATEEDKLNNAGLYYKFRSHSQDAITQEVDTAGNLVNVYHLERYVPVFSYMMFQTKQIDAKKNYEYFFPESGWQGDGGFNVANAAVKPDGYAVPTSNGYVYRVSEVLDPLNTIYKELEDAGKYTRFLELFDRYEYYAKDELLTREYGNGTDLYQHYHSPMPNLACEWPTTSYLNVASNSWGAYTVFAPTDDAFMEFFDDYWKSTPEVPNYDSLAEVPDASIQALLLNSLYGSSIVFPEEIEKGLIENTQGFVIKIETDRVAQEDRKICLNGVLYGCEYLTPPAQFYSVTGPAYQYKKFSNFVTMLNGSGMISSLCSDAVDYIMLFSSNEQMQKSAGITYDETKKALVTTASPNGIKGVADYVYAHVASPMDGDCVIPESGVKVIANVSPTRKLYWYVKDGRVTNCIKFNDLLKHAENTVTENDVFCEIHPLAYRGDVDGWSNGRCYELDGFFEGTYDNVANPNFVSTMWKYQHDATTQFYAWVKLLDKAKLIDRNAQSINFMAESCLMLVPTTEKLEAAILAGKIPGIVANGATVGDATFFDMCEITDAAALEYYIKQYFIPLSTAVMSNYPYLGWGEKTEEVGGLITMQSEEIFSEDGKSTITTTNMNIYDKDGKLSVQVIAPEGESERPVVEVIPDYYYLPFVYNDGCVHFIDGVLE